MYGVPCRSERRPVVSRITRTVSSKPVCSRARQNSRRLPNRRDRDRTHFILNHTFLRIPQKPRRPYSEINRTSPCAQAIPCHPFHSFPAHLHYVFPQNRPDVGTDAKLARFQRRDLGILQLAVPDLESVRFLTSAPVCHRGKIVPFARSTFHLHNFLAVLP